MAWFIIVACAATLYVHGYHNISDAKDAAQALHPLAGDYAYILFAMGLFNASLFAASILPLSTAYAVCEGLGFESGVGKRFSEAPVFYWLYTILIVAGAGVILLPNIPLVKISILSQVVNGVVLPFVLVFMLLLVNKKEIMGEYVSSRALQRYRLGDDGNYGGTAPWPGSGRYVADEFKAGDHEPWGGHDFSRGEEWLTNDGFSR